MSTYIPDFLSAQEAQTLFDYLLSSAQVCWREEQFKLFGKTMPVPRRLTWYGDSGVNYRYTGLDHIAQGWPAALLPTLAKVRAVARCSFNYVLLNRYDHGGQHMGWHCDDERSADPCIASLSLGQTRRFKILAAADGETETLDLEHGSLLVFDGRKKHMLAKTKRQVATRINLTFRLIHV